MRVGDGMGWFSYLGWAGVGLCYPSTCPEDDTQNVVGVKCCLVQSTPTPLPAGTPTPTPASYTVYKYAEDEDYWYTSGGGQSSAAAWSESTQLVRKDVVGTTLINGLVAYKYGDPEGCSIYYTDSQTPRSKGYIYVFNVEYTINPNDDGGLDLTYTISPQPTFSSTQPCQTPFVHSVNISICDPDNNRIDSSDSITLSGWTDTWEWDGHFTTGDVDWYKCDNLTITFSGKVAGFAAWYSGSHPPNCTGCTQVDEDFGKEICYPLPPCDDTTKSAIQYYISGVPDCNYQQTAVSLWSRDDDCGNRLEYWCEPVGTSAAYILRYNGKPIHCCLYNNDGYNMICYYMTGNGKRFHSTYTVNEDLSPLGSSGDEGTLYKYDWTVYSYDCICDRWVPSTPHDYPLCFETTDFSKVGTEEGAGSSCEDCNDLNLD